MASDASRHTALDPEGSVRVRVVLLFGDQVEIATDTEDADIPERYPAAEVTTAVGLEPSELPGKRLTARLGAGHRLEDFRLA
ncbi:hypothetical protein PV350_02110 [Streptomyces sp. PA03-6a]|nr:hypothetical protein [Streptomyces sp. PA03-6a]